LFHVKRPLATDTLAAGTDVHQRFAALAASLGKLDHPDQSFHIVNRLFGQTGYDWSKGYLALTAKAYGAALEPLDLRANAEQARLHINAWIEDKTNKKIVDLLPPSASRTSSSSSASARCSCPTPI
jgi:serine protease inhibitor